MIKYILLQKVLKTFSENRKEIINDAIIIDIAENGIKIDCINKFRYTGIPHILLSKYEKHVISAEIQKLLKKGVIKVCTHKP